MNVRKKSGIWRFFYINSGAPRSSSADLEKEPAAGLRNLPAERVPHWMRLRRGGRVASADSARQGGGRGEKVLPAAGIN